MAMSDRSQALSLFDNPSNHERLYFLTNRYNLLEFLSAGRILPRCAIGKYYEDLLCVSDGYIPTFSAEPPADVIAQASSESPTSFPVIVELDPSRILDFSEVGGFDGQTASMVVWQQSLPMSATRAIWFRTDIERAEHLARSYRNVPSFESLSVNAALFSSKRTGLERIDRYLAELPPLDTTGLRAQLHSADRLAGADLASGLPTAAGSLVQLPTPLMNNGGQRFLEIVWGVFNKHHPAAGWRPSQILADVTELLDPGQDDSMRMMDRIGAVVTNHQSFQDVAPDLDPPARAFLAVLLRPDPARILGLAPELGEEAVEKAMALAGGLLGFKESIKPNGVLDYGIVDKRFDAIEREQVATQLHLGTGN
jgi:hypothetical protein